jgi:ATP-dependent Clp protease adapter protein ClpS
VPAPEGPRGVRALPARPHLEHLKNQAKARLRVLKTADPAARLATAQFQIAREYGFPSWRRLKAHVEKAAAGQFGVMLLNDDKTPMEFVVHVLGSVFGLTRHAATGVMLAAHENGMALAGLYDRREADRLADQVRALAKKHGHPFDCTVEPADRIAPAAPGSIALALAQGASAADVARMMQTQGKPADPDTAVWVKAPELPGGFGLGYTGRDGRHNLTMIPDFFGYTPPGGIDNLPTLEGALGPEPPPPPPSPEMAAVGEMVMAGATPLEVATALHALGVFDQPGPQGEVLVVDLATARFARLPNRRVVLLVNHSEGRGFRGQAIPGTEAYPYIEVLPDMPRPDGLGPQTPSWVGL